VRDERRDELTAMTAKLDQLKASFADMRREMLAAAESQDERTILFYFFRRERRELRKVERRLERMRSELG
jgi:hypothetical protein